MGLLVVLKLLILLKLLLLFKLIKLLTLQFVPINYRLPPSFFLLSILLLFNKPLK